MAETRWIAGAAALTAVVAMWLGSCRRAEELGAGAPGPSRSEVRTGKSAEDPYVGQRRHMVRTQLRGRDIDDQTVLRVMADVPRHLYVPEQLHSRAYDDTPLPIGDDQTISQPYIVAYMTQALELEAGDRVLEIGTGSGYQAAVLAEIADQVYTIEIIPSLARTAQTRLLERGYSNIHVRTGDGYFGWPEAAPFDAIIVTAAPDHVPPALVAQLAEGASLVMPVGDDYQELVRIRRRDGRSTFEHLLPVRFVPMTGEAQAK